jgi:cytochrome c peroxidase
MVATFVFLLMAAVAAEDALLKQAQEIFQPLPKDMATVKFPITTERVQLGRSLFF